MKQAIEVPYLHLETERGFSVPCTRVEPGEYEIDLKGTVISGEEENEDEVVGRWEACRVLLNSALENGFSWINTLDAISCETADFCTIAKDASWRDEIMERFEAYGGELLLLRRIEIDPNYRGRGYGLVVAKGIIDAFAGPECLVGLKPFPLQYCREDHPGLQVPEHRKQFNADRKKVAAHWRLLGFSSPKKSPELMVLSTSRRNPTIEQALSRYFKRNGADGGN